MQLKEAKTITEALGALLEREKQALIRGDLDRLPDLLRRKESLLRRFGQIRSERVENLTHLKDKVARNQRLLNGAMEGIRDVVERLNAMRKSEKSLDTYDRRGQKYSVVSQPKNKLEKRA